MASMRAERSDNIGSDDAENSGKVLKKASSFVVVAAIDFGTTYSGYAYSLTDDYYNDHMKVYANAHWSAEGTLLSFKAPTTVLFDKDGHFHSFGFQAETKYAKLAEEEKHVEWQYFSRFKMELYGNKEQDDSSNTTTKKRKRITKDMKLTDDQGNEKLALEVFSATIAFLKDHLMARVKDKLIDVIEPKHIMWVLTVPAIWDDGAKQFMEEAASMAGIPQTQLVIALEPECAAIFCKELNIQKAQETNRTAYLKPFDTGEQFMVVDLGGGTVDITAHEVSNDGSLKELTPPSGGPWGGMVVDEAYINFLHELFTKKVMVQFGTGKHSKSDHLDLVWRFEKMKRALRGDCDSVLVDVPSFLYEIFQDVHGKSFETRLKQSDLSQTVEKNRHKLLCDSKHFIDLFIESKKHVIAHIKELLARPELRKVSTLLLVGGFSESEIMSEALKIEFNTKRVVVPAEAGLAVVKGAVMYGFNENSISSRIMRFTYGIAAAVPYDDRFHPHSKKVVRYGRAKCEDIFKVFVEKDKEVVPDKEIVENTFNCPYIGASGITIEIYTSDQKEPKFIDDPGSRKVGQLTVQLQRSDPDQVQMINVKMLFGKTQLEVQAREHGRLGGAVKAKFDFLGY